MFIDYEEELNEAQLAAVRYLDGASLVIAGAGSGKTRVLTYKISYLLEQGYEPWSILALTFTNKAAREMKGRIAERVGERTASYLWMGTFHSVFSKILRREAHRLGYDSNFTIYDQSDSRSLLKSIIKEMQLDDKIYKPNVVGERISAAKSRLIFSADYARDTGLRGDDMRARIPSLYEIYGRYEARCRQANAMDFDDLLVNTYRLFDEYPDVLAKYVEQFRYVLVDEFQDTNYVQASIVWLLTKERRAICVVGDDAQSIYSFRGANIGNILGFTQRYENAAVFKLEQNYRSTRMIVNAANSLIAKNCEQIHKTVFSERGVGEPISVCSAYSDYEEVEIVANRIARLMRGSSLRFKDFAILYRTNAQSRLFEEAFRKRAFPYKIYGGLSFYQRKEIKDVISYFRFICNQRDEEALKRIINYPARGIGDTTMQKIRDLSETLGQSMWNVMCRPLLYNLNVNKGTLAKLQAFTDMMGAFIALAMETDAMTVAREVVQKSGVWADVFTGNTVEDRSRQENMQELMNAIDSFVDMRREEGDEDDKLMDYISSVQLLTDQDGDSDDDDNITLMTVHSAKGLEFPAVFVVGLEEELFPNSLAQSSLRELEEERRLFYVAITRAMDYCMLTFAKSRHRYGSFCFCEPSRFIKEIDRSCLSFNGNMSGGMAVRQQQGGERRYFERQQHSESLQRTVASSSPQRLQRVSDAVRGASSQASGNFAFAVGDIVTHDRFGVGQVLSLEGSNDNAKAKIKFKNAGEKTLLLKFAELKVVK